MASDGFVNEHGLLFQVVTWAVPVILAITFHEVAHGEVARIFGDTTAADRGRLSLNPLRHVDPVGTIILPIVLAVTGMPVFGWAKPVPVDRSRLRNPRWHGLLVTAAGPLSNLVLAVAGAAGLRATLALTGGSESFGKDFAIALFADFMLANLFLGTFNLIPVPPFDGGRIVAALLPPRIGRRYERLDRYGLLVMLFLLVLLPQIAPNLNILGRLIDPPVHWLLAALGRVFGFA